MNDRNIVATAAAFDNDVWSKILNARPRRPASSGIVDTVRKIGHGSLEQAFFRALVSLKIIEHKDSKSDSRKYPGYLEQVRSLRRVRRNVGVDS